MFDANCRMSQIVRLGLGLMETIRTSRFRVQKKIHHPIFISLFTRKDVCFIHQLNSQYMPATRSGKYYFKCLSTKITFSMQWSKELFVQWSISLYSRGRQYHRQFLWCYRGINICQARLLLFSAQISKLTTQGLNSETKGAELML